MLLGKREDFLLQRPANEKPGVDHGLLFSANVAHPPLAVCFEKEAKGSDHAESQLFGRPTRRAIVEQDLTSGQLERKRNRLGLAGGEG